VRLLSHTSITSLLLFPGVLDFFTTASVRFRIASGLPSESAAFYTSNKTTEWAVMCLSLRTRPWPRGTSKTQSYLIMNFLAFAIMMKVLAWHPNTMGANCTTVQSFLSFFFLLWGGTCSLCMPALKAASQAGPVCNSREGTSVAREFNLKVYAAITWHNDPASPGLKPRLADHHTQAARTAMLPTAPPEQANCTVIWTK